MSAAFGKRRFKTSKNFMFKFGSELLNHRKIFLTRLFFAENSIFSKTDKNGFGNDFDTEFFSDFWLNFVFQAHDFPCRRAAAICQRECVFGRKSGVAWCVAFMKAALFDKPRGGNFDVIFVRFEIRDIFNASIFSDFLKLFVQPKCLQMKLKLF